jgi:hypothetical protein
MVMTVTSWPRFQSNTKADEGEDVAAAAGRVQKDVHRDQLVGNRDQGEEG